MLFQIISLSWFALGLLSVVVIEIDGRRGHTDGPLSQENVLISTLWTLALIVCAPALTYFVLEAVVQMLRQGRIPINGKKVWWPPRARQVDREKGPPSQSEILCSMIKVRKRHDRRLRGENPSNWPMFRLWASPEATILDAVSDFYWLLDGGLSELEAVGQLQSLDAAENLKTGAKTLQGLIEQKLRQTDPSYLDMNTDVLTKNVALAKHWAQEEINWIKSRPPYPPLEWLESPTHIGEAAPEPVTVPALLQLSPGKREWRRLKARMAKDDELRSFCSPPKSWQSLTGRKGVALVRGGKPIAHVVTLMN